MSSSCDILTTELCNLWALLHPLSMRCSHLFGIMEYLHLSRETGNSTIADSLKSHTINLIQLKIFVKRLLNGKCFFQAFTRGRVSIFNVSLQIILLCQTNYIDLVFFILLYVMSTTMGHLMSAYFRFVWIKYAIIVLNWFLDQVSLNM